MTKKLLNRRYYLHRKIKKKGIKYSPFLRTVYWSFSKPVDNNHVANLQREFNYSVQLEIE